MQRSWRVPLGRGEAPQPVGSEGRDGVERRPQRLGQQFHAVEVAHCGQHVGAVGPLTPARLEHALVARVIEYAGQQPFGCLVLQQSAAKLTQDAVVEAGIGQIKTQQVRPVDPGPNRVSCLTVAEAFAKLQEGDEGQAPGCAGRVAAGGIEVSELGISEDRAEPRAQKQVGVATPERRLSDAGGILGHWRQRELGSERHRRPPNGTASLHPQARSKNSPAVSGCFIASGTRAAE